MSPGRSDPLDDYMRAVEAVPPLTDQEERGLWDAIMHGDGSDAAKKRLIEAHLHLVFPVAARYEGRGRLVVDLVEEGNIGLYEQSSYSIPRKIATSPPSHVA